MDRSTNMLKLRSVPIAVLAVLTAWLLASCAETSDLLVERTHPEGWNDPSEEAFHGKFVLESANPSESCQSCHGQNYKGGSSGVACASCHEPHHDAARDCASNSTEPFAKRKVDDRRSALPSVPTRR